MFYGESQQGTASNASQTFARAEVGRMNICGTDENPVCEKDIRHTGETSVNTKTSHEDPVLVGYLATANGAEATDLRVQDVDATSFEVAMQEPSPDSDSAHLEVEEANWLKVPRGHWLIATDDAADGNCVGVIRIDCTVPSSDTPERNMTHLQAGTTSTKDPHRWSRANFSDTFDARPAVFSSLNSYNDDRFLAIQAAGVDQAGFDLREVPACIEDLNGADGTAAWIAAEREAGAAIGTDGNAFNTFPSYWFDRHEQDGDKDGFNGNSERIRFVDPDDEILVQGDTDTGDPFWARGIENDVDSVGVNVHEFGAHESDDNGCEDSHADSGFSFVRFTDGSLEKKWTFALMNNTVVESSVGPEVSLLASSDSDGDEVSDTLEETLCGRPVENRLIGDSREKTGDCEVSGTDYSPTENETWLISPSLVHAGEDRDGDGIPAAVNVSYTNVTLNVTDTDPTDVRLGATVKEKLDFNDTDPDTPATDTPCTLLEAPQGVTTLVPGPDTDGDSVPRNVWVTRGRICAEETGITVDPSAKQTAPDLDPDDDDPALTGGTEVTSDPVPKNASFSLDFDDDQFPCYGYIGYVEVTFNRSTHEYTTNTWTEKRSWDPDCFDADNPTGLESALDSDDDLIPDATEDDACGAQNSATSIDGYCTDLDTNYHPAVDYELTLDPDI